MQIKRLLQVAHHASLQRLVPRGGRAKGRHHDQAGLRAMSAYPLEQFKAIGSRHFQIANDEVILFGPEDAYGLCPVHHPTDEVTILAQRVNNAPVEVLFVLNYENTPLIRHSYHRLFCGVNVLFPVWDALMPTFYLRVSLIPITIACSRLRRSPDVVCGVENALAHFPHHILHQARRSRASTRREKAKTLNRVSFSRDKCRKGNRHFRAEPLITGNSHHTSMMPDDAAHDRES